MLTAGIGADSKFERARIERGTTLEFAANLFAASRPLVAKARFSFLLTAAAGYFVEENVISSVRGPGAFRLREKNPREASTLIPSEMLPEQRKPDGRED
jgi:hypothetical protein